MKKALAGPDGVAPSTSGNPGSSRNSRPHPRAELALDPDPGRQPTRFTLHEPRFTPTGTQNPASKCPQPLPPSAYSLIFPISALPTPSAYRLRPPRIRNPQCEIRNPTAPAPALVASRFTPTAPFHVARPRQAGRAKKILQIFLFFLRHGVDSCVFLSRIPSISGGQASFTECPFTHLIYCIQDL